MRIIAFYDIDTNTEHMDKVVMDMRVMGAPTIRAVETAHGTVAIEGAHRLAAAYELGLTPDVEIVGTLTGDLARDNDYGFDCLGDLVDSINRYPYDLGKCYDF